MESKYFMKKVLFILPILALIACDKKNSEKEIENCINQIADIVFCSPFDCESLYISYNGFEHELTAEEAVQLSPNWSYGNMHRYLPAIFDGTLEEHEKDACETLERLKNYLQEHGVNN